MFRSDTEQHTDVWANKPRLLWELREMDFTNTSLAQNRVVGKR